MSSLAISVNPLTQAMVDATSVNAFKRHFMICVRRRWVSLWTRSPQNSFWLLVLFYDTARWLYWWLQMEQRSHTRCEIFSYHAGAITLLCHVLKLRLPYLTRKWSASRRYISFNVSCNASSGHTGVLDKLLDRVTSTRVQILDNDSTSPRVS